MVASLRDLICAALSAQRRSVRIHRLPMLTVRRQATSSLDAGGVLYLRDGGTFADICLLSARIAGDADLNRSTVTGKLESSMRNAWRLEVPYF